MANPKMHADEVDVDESLVRGLLAGEFPEWSALPIEPVPFFGTDNAIYRLGLDMSVRLPRREQSVAPLEKELRWLPMLAPLIPLAIPRPLAVGNRDDHLRNHGFIREAGGWRLSPAYDVNPNLNKADHALTDTMVREIKGVLALGPREGWEVPIIRTEAVRGEGVDELGEIDVDAVTAEWDAALAAPEWTGRPVWLHGDLDARNLLVNDGRLYGVIDWGALAVGDPACDVMVAWKMLSADTRESFRTALAVDDATWARSRGWAVSQAVMALAYYTVETNPLLVRESQCWLAAVLGS